MSDPRVEQIKLALKGQQSGGGLDDIRVYMGPSRQVGRGFGDFVKNIGMKIIPVIVRTAKKLFTSSSEALKDGSSIGDSFKAAIKPTLRTALKHGGKALGKIIQEQAAPAAAPPVEPPLLHQDERDVGTVTPVEPQAGGGRYKAPKKRKSQRLVYASKRPNIHYNF